MGSQATDKATSEDTIYALSTAPLRAAVAVVRVSGPRAGDALARLAGGIGAPRRATLRVFRDPDDAERIDEGIALWLSAPATFTGEDMAELHVHGGTAVVARLLAAIAKLPGFRPAEPGEFARRAFENGKFDLSRLEGIADLVDAQTEAQRRAAARLADGGVAREAESIRDDLLVTMALVEAEIDFADEGDAPDDVRTEVVSRCAAILGRLEGALRGAAGAARLREGMMVAIVGAPNVGKSTLINALSGRDVAIVSALPGTTRDALETWIDLDGLPVCFIDTAGLRDSDDPIEQEGVRRATQRAASADVVLAVRVADRGPMKVVSDPRVIKVRNKSDLDMDAVRPASAVPAVNEEIAISAKLGIGLDALRAAMTRKLRAALDGGETALLSRERHRLAFERAAMALRLIIGETDRPLEVLAEDLRVGATAMGRVTGRIDVEDILGDIFSRFCIGK